MVCAMVALVGKMDGSALIRRTILIQLMQQRGMSNVRLAELSGLDKVSISRYRTGKSLLNDVPTLEKLAKALNVDVCVFFPGERAESNQESMLIKTIFDILRVQTGTEITLVRKDIESLRQLLLPGAPPPLEAHHAENERRSGNFRRAADTVLHQTKE